MTSELLNSLNSILMPASHEMITGQFIAVEQAISENNTSGCSGSCDGNCSAS